MAIILSNSFESFKTNIHFTAPSTKEIHNKRVSQVVGGIFLSLIGMAALFGGCYLLSYISVSGFIFGGILLAVAGVLAASAGKEMALDNDHTIDLSNESEIANIRCLCKDRINTIYDLLQQYEPWQIFYYQIITPIRFQELLNQEVKTIRGDLDFDSFNEKVVTPIRKGIWRAEHTQPPYQFANPKIHYLDPQLKYDQAQMQAKIEWQAQTQLIT